MTKTGATESNGPNEFPTADELPEDPPDPDALDPFEEDPSHYDDINAFVRAEHAANTAGN